MLYINNEIEYPCGLKVKETAWTLDLITLFYPPIETKQRQCPLHAQNCSWRLKRVKR